MKKYFTLFLKVNIINKMQKLKIIIKYISLIYEKYGIILLIKIIYDYSIINRDLNKKLREIKKMYGPINYLDTSFRKYLLNDIWLMENMLRYYDLNLFKSEKKLDILDLGCGAGYFIYVCKYYGHNAIGIDLFEIEMYNLITEKLEIKRYEIYIEKFVKININKKFDVITAYMICFNKHKTNELWHLKEWEFFISDLENNCVNQEYMIYLSFNEENKNETVSIDLKEFLENKFKRKNKNEFFLKSYLQNTK